MTIVVEYLDFLRHPQPVAVHDSSQVLQALAEGFRLVLAESKSLKAR